ncbi:hypothetical protein ACJRO7_035316 [Eucalyptus globulus]|uniref:Uncharacterized protein n=1 Tax=Eucalyptus globulus TaxID=34317 RepID=A0ABD3J6Y4_EUCGL
MISGTGHAELNETTANSDYSRPLRQIRRVRADRRRKGSRESDDCEIGAPSMAAASGSDPRHEIDANRRRISMNDWIETRKRRRKSTYLGLSLCEKEPQRLNEGNPVFAWVA